MVNNLAEELISRKFSEGLFGIRFDDEKWDLNFPKKIIPVELTLKC